MAPSILKLIAGSMLLASMTNSSAAGPIEDRQALMKGVGKAIGAIVAMAKKEAPFDAAVINTSATTISGNLEKVKDLFPDGSFEGPPETWAKPAIAEDRAGFDQARMKAHEAAVAMAAIAEESQLEAALGTLGDGCKGCHEKFRRPKE
jgi:cytochrome c556